MSSDTLDDLRQRAQQALAEGQYQQARQLFHQALGVHGDHPDVHHGLATVCFLLNDLHGAAYHFMEVTRLDPVRAGAYINLGAVYNRMEKYDDAITALRRGIQIDSNRAEGYYNLGVVYKQKGQLDMALSAYREATRINPRMADAHYNIGNIYLEKEQFGIAIGHYRQALELRPNWDKAKKSLDSALARTGAPPNRPSAVEIPVVPDPKQKKLDPERLLDPHVQGNLLRDVHQVIIEVDKQGHQLLAVIEQDVERAIRELSNCLLFPNNPGNDLASQIKKFDAVMALIQQHQKALQKKLQVVRELGEQIVQL